MIIITNNDIYEGPNGVAPPWLVSPYYLIFTPLGFITQYTKIEPPVPFDNPPVPPESSLPPLPPLPPPTISIIINPWTYWSNNEKLDSIRLQRDYLLQQTDWRAIRAYETQTPESQDWLDYRQALRDFPQTVDVSLPIQQIVWPTPPS